MGLFNIWMLTIIIDFFYKTNTKIKTYKTYADLGYIYDHKRLHFIEETDMEEEMFILWFIYKFGKFIPLYNLYQSFIRKLNICIDAKDRIDLFEEYNIIEKMTINEKEEYNKKCTGMSALKLRRKLNKKRRNLEMIVYSDGSTIFYKYNDKIEEDNLLDGIEIVEARGRFEGKSNEELRNIVYNSHLTVAETILNNYENTEEFFDDNNNNNYIEHSFNKREEYPNTDELEKNTSKKRVRKK